MYGRKVGNEIQMKRLGNIAGKDMWPSFATRQH